FAAASADLDFTRIDKGLFAACPADSIDYAVMEKTSDAVVVPLAAGWSDVGSWAALHEASDPDAFGNVSRGDVIAEDSEGCFLYAESRLVSAVGLKDHVVVETKDAVLVAPRSRVQDVKKLVHKRKEQGRSEHWIVVSGTARITRGDEVFLLEENQSTYIPIGVRHRIENPGKIPLHIIEVQSGSYLGEDDIVRLEDHYGRKGTTT